MERVHVCMCWQTTMQKIAEIEAEVGAVAVCCFRALCVRPRVLSEIRRWFCMCFSGSPPASHACVGTTLMCCVHGCAGVIQRGWGFLGGGPVSFRNRLFPTRFLFSPCSPVFPSDGPNSKEQGYIPARWSAESQAGQAANRAGVARQGLALVHPRSLSSCPVCLAECPSSSTHPQPPSNPCVPFRALVPVRTTPLALTCPRCVCWGCLFPLLCWSTSSCRCVGRPHFS
jgi:hypothetical protein